MLPPSARALWPFFVRADARRVVPRRARAWLCPTLSPIICLFKIWLTFMYLSFGRVAGFLPALGCGSVVWRACHVLEGSCSNPAADQVNFFERIDENQTAQVENRSNTNREIARAAMARTAVVLLSR